MVTRRTTAVAAGADAASGRREGDSRRQQYSRGQGTSSPAGAAQNMWSRTIQTSKTANRRAEISEAHRAVFSDVKTRGPKT